MDTSQKEQLLADAKRHLQKVREKIKESLSQVFQVRLDIREKLSTLSPQDQLVQARILQNQTKREAELGALYPSPYFIKCIVTFEGQESTRIFYFSKFSLPEENIYSWTSPAAVLRFENLGKFMYSVPEFNNKTGILEAKDQYMISKGKIVYMATESKGQQRELIYQEYFSQQKSSFVLREIVEQMEKAQDKVIRAPLQGSFLITGPAGSGKTTLALHRVAYLLQSPDTASRFASLPAIVFVQDQSTKAYFGKLLPDLGVENVQIVTFFEWAREHLGLDTVSYVYRYGKTEREKDEYEFTKNKALQELSTHYISSDPFKALASVYMHVLSTEQQALFNKQFLERVVDRFDITVLLKLLIQRQGSFVRYETQYEQMKGGRVKRSKIAVPLQYGLVILDEAQNFLPQQIELIRGCLAQAQHSVIYVGDLRQQTQLCTIHDWNQAGERFTEENTAELQKNYRSTKQITQYIKELGYDVEVLQSLRDGNSVVEKEIGKDYVLKAVNDILLAHEKEIVGIIALEESTISALKNKLVSEKVHVLTAHEAQGVEFDVVVYLKSQNNTELGGMDKEFANEVIRVNRDLEYVALTRAMNYLYLLKTR